MKSFNHTLKKGLFYWILLCISKTIATINFENQAKLSSTGGHLYIVGASGKNISIMTNGKGCVNLNNINLLETIRLAKEATDKVSFIETNQLSTISNSINTLQDVLLGEAGLQQRLITVEAKIRNGSTGSGSRKDIPKSVISKIESLQKSVRKLTTLLTTNECSSNPCQNGGTCQDLFNGFQCVCTDAWMGPYCNVDVNECSRFYNTDLGCQNGAECKNTPGSYECICASGWFGLHCTRSSNDCTSSSSKELCGNGVCVNKGKGAGYTCICDQGWTTNGTSPACTEDVDECAKHTFPCSRNPLVKCENTKGSFTCGPCPPGYEGNGFYCIDVDECQTNNGGCSISPRVQCINTMGSRICSSCPFGYTGDGITCTESAGGICSVNNGGCHQDALCSEYGQGRVQCICRTGYVGSGIGFGGCVPLGPTASICNGNACVNGNCVPYNSTSYTCTCYAGYAGRYCETRSSACINNPCKNGATCIAHSDYSFTCECNYNFRGKFCEEEAAECGDSFTNENGILRYPTSNYTSIPRKGAIECSWIIMGNDTKIINVTVVNYQPGGENLNCKSYLEFRDGTSELDTLITRLCGPVTLKSVSSNSNNMYIRLKGTSNERSQISTLALNWTSSNPVCGEFINFDSHGSFSSPGYPGSYPDNRDCYWRLVAPLSKRIQFHFFSFKMEHHENCSFDFLEIHDGLEVSSPLLQKYCHNSTPPALTTSGPNALVYFHSDSSFGLDGFQISYTAIEGIPGCGGVLSSPTGNVIFPLEGQSYQGDINCEWKIQLPVGERVKITFISFTSDISKNCLNNKIELREGSSVMSSTLMARYCTTDKPSQPIVSTSNEVFLVLSMKSSTVTPLRFNLNYETVCGGDFMAPSGIIKSPYYPNQYPLSRTCIYIIAQPINKAISLTINDLDIVSPTQKLCNIDYLEIRDGENENATVIKKLCDRNNNKTFQSFLSTYNYMYLKYKTELSNTGRGFIANYSTIDITCGGILKSSSGMIESPKYPDEYPSLAKCRWIISADPGYIISLTFITFQLENHSRCIRDYVEIFDNSTVPGQFIGKYCGNKIPAPITSVGNRLSLYFKTDFSVSADGFQANYVTKDARKTCGSRLTATNGVIKSPNYPDKYPNAKECVWTISANMGYQITLNVTDFNLEKGSSSCSYDYLEIRDGGYATSPLFGKYCGTTIPEIITSTSNQMYIKFYSDTSRPKTGFYIMYDTSSTGCGGTLTGSTGQIASPNYMQPQDQRIECFWKIVVSSGNAIRVNLLDLDLRTSWGLTQCSSLDYIEFFDGDSAKSKSLGRYCRENEITTIRSNGNKMFIKYKISGYSNNRGFLLRYATDCNNTLTGFRGVIESPNFPNPYVGSLNCFWVIDAPLGNNISITFTHFNFGSPVFQGSEFYTRPYPLTRRIPSSNKTENCSNSGRLEVTEGAEFFYRSYGIMCGNTLPGKINSITNSVRVHLTTNAQQSNDGFRLEWAVLGCGGLLEKPTGSFQSPRYPNHYPNSIQCDWHITVGWQMSIEITIRDFDFENFDNCTLDSLTIYGGPDTTAAELVKLCHTQKSPLVVTTSGNHAFVRFLADSSFSSKGFYATYKTINTTCGGLLKSPTGTFHTSKYPQNYGPTDDCIWLIEVPATHLINLTIVDFNTRKSNYVSDWLTVYDGDSSNSSVLLRHAGNEAPNPRWLISTSNKLYVRFTAISSFQAKGFLAKYTIACGARILTNDTGVITNHDALTTIMDPLNCSWVIMSYMPDAKITLTITHMDLISGGLDDTSCYDHNVTIIDGEDSTDPVKNTLCGYKIPPSITSSGAAIRVEYYAANKFQIHGSFIATYSVFTDACGGNLTSQEGEFTSPHYPNAYPNKAECVWQIQTAPGHKVSLTFTAFDLESSEFCNQDYVEIRQKDSTGQLLGAYCGSSIPTNVTIASSMWIKFRSDESSNTKTGFSAYYTLTHANEISGTSGQIASPFYPMPYNRNGQFSWRVSVSHGMAIRIAFDNVYLNTFSDETCTSYVKVYDGYDETAPILSTVCDSAIPTPFKSTGNIVFITFETSPLSMGVYFLLSWSQEIRTLIVSPTATSPKPGNCDYDIMLSLSSSNKSDYSYKVTSPGYPYGYDKLLKCTWNIRTEVESHIEFVFSAVDLESRSGCYGDSITISTSSVESTEMKLLGKICELPSTKRYYGSNYMKIEFTSDYYENKTGFAGTAYVACGGSVSGPSGVLEATNTSNWYGSSIITCQWNITVRAGRKINITFVDFNLPPASVTDGQTVCGTEYVLLRNGLSTESPYLGNGRYCGTSPPSVPLSSQNKVYVKFSSLKNKKFKMIYEEEPVECGGQIILKSKNNFVPISSPNYPNVPPPYTECTWIITAALGEKIRFDLLDINLQKSDFCNKEYLEIRDGASEDSLLLNRQCSSNIGNSIESNGNYLYVKYYTSVEEPDNGFKANISIGKCGGVYRGMDGVITSPSYPASYSPNLQCTYHIITDENTFITISFDQINLNKIRYSTKKEKTDEIDSIMVYDVQKAPSFAGKHKNDTDTLLATVLGSSVMAPVNTTSNEALIVFHSYAPLDPSLSYYPKNDLRFMISYTAHHSSCRESIEGVSGIIESPIVYKLNPWYCSWKITVPFGRRVTLEFVQAFSKITDDASLNQGMEWVLSNQRITIYGDLERKTRLAYFTDSLSIRRIVKSSSNTLFLSYQVFQSSGQPSLKFKYSSDEPAVCGGRLTGTNGTIQSPGMNESAHYSCSWEIMTADIDKTLVLEVRGNLGVFSIYECQEYLSSLIIKTQELSDVQSLFCNNIGDQPFIVLMPVHLTKIQAYRSNSFNGSNVNFSINYYERSCGGILRGPNDNISMGFYTENTYCAWAIRYPPGSKLRVSFGLIDMDASCIKNKLLIYNGAYRSAPLARNICGNIAQNALITSSNNLWIEFHSTVPANKVTFNLSIVTEQSACGGEENGVQGVLTSPGYPDEEYPNNAECEWIITVQQSYHIGLSFIDRFYLEDSRNCSNDFVQIFDYNFKDEEWKSLGSVCGRNIPPTFNSTSHKMKVLFRSNGDVRSDGFKAMWNVNCGGIYLDSGGIIYSPNYPSVYPPNSFCNYTIYAPGKFIDLEFTAFQLESASLSICDMDNVTIYTQNYNKKYNIVGSYCGTSKPPNQRLKNSVSIVFKSDYMIEKTGFIMRYSTYNCGGNITTPSLISSPTESNNYFPSSNCTWYITAPANQTVTLRFSEFHLEGSECEYDRVTIWSGLTKNKSNVLPPLCGDLSDRPPIVKSSNNQMVVEFISDETSHYPGFTAEVIFAYGESAGCGYSKLLNSTDDNYIIKSPKLDQINVCTWQFRTEASRSIKLTFQSFTMDSCNSTTNKTITCGACNHISIHDGLGEKDETIVTICGVPVPKVISSSGYSLTLVYYLKDLKQNTNFTIKVESALQTPICGPSALIATSVPQVLTSPSSPNGYPTNIRCKWFISSTSSNMVSDISIRVIDIDIDESPKCVADRLEIKPTSSVTSSSAMPQKLCSKAHLLDAYYWSDSVQVLFVSDDIYTGKTGFKLQYQIGGCSRNYTEGQGRIYSYEYVPCESVIFAPNLNQTISLYFYSFYIYTKYDDCQQGNITVYDGYSKDSPLLSTICGRSKPNPVFSTGPYLRISLNPGTDSTSSSAQYDISYTTTDQGRGCGGRLFNLHGVISSPLYPGSYRNKTTCRWDLSVPHPNNIKIKFQAMDIGSASSCNTDYLEISDYDSESNTEKFISKYCGGDRPSSHISYTNAVIIRYVTSINNAGSGWMIAFDTVAPGDRTDFDYDIAYSNMAG